MNIDPDGHEESEEVADIFVVDDAVVANDDYAVVVYDDDGDDSVVGENGDDDVVDDAVARCVIRIIDLSYGLSTITLPAQLR